MCIAIGIHRYTESEYSLHLGVGLSIRESFWSTLVQLARYTLSFDIAYPWAFHAQALTQSPGKPLEETRCACVPHTCRNATHFIAGRFTDHVNSNARTRRIDVYSCSIWHWNRKYSTLQTRASQSNYATHPTVTYSPRRHRTTQSHRNKTKRRIIIISSSSSYNTETSATLRLDINCWLCRQAARSAHPS